MKLADALFNWLQIRIVADARPDDWAAGETVRFFTEILEQDHRVTALSHERDGERYLIRYTVDGEEKVQSYHREAAEQLLTGLACDPRFDS